MTTVTRWFAQIPAPSVGAAWRGRRTVGNSKCEGEDRSGLPSRPAEHWLARMVGLIGGLRISGVVGYVIGAGWRPQRDRVLPPRSTKRTTRASRSRSSVSASNGELDCRRGQTWVSQIDVNDLRSCAVNGR